jgi:hypothetical protein
MSTKNVHILLIGAAIAGASSFATPSAEARPASGQYVEDARGDAIASRPLSNELGDATLFPTFEAIAYHDHRSNFYPGVADYGIFNDWTVHLTNVSGQAWKDLFFVADLGATIGNADGRVEDLGGAPGVLTDAFRIDSAGANAPLYHESITADGILQVGEEWEFAVTNFGTGFNSLPPSLVTPGKFAGSSPMVDFGGTNSSILAVPVPEPATLGLFTLAALSLLARRRRRPV